MNQLELEKTEYKRLAIPLKYDLLPIQHLNHPCFRWFPIFA